MGNFMASDNDAFLLSIPDWIYYYALQTHLDTEGKEQHYYKENKKNNIIREVSEHEIIAMSELSRKIIRERKKLNSNIPFLNLFKICPCVKIKDNRLIPLVENEPITEP